MITLTITLDEATGSTNVNGPLENKIICYGLLKLAEQIVANYEPPKPSGLVIANGPIVAPRRHQ